MSWCEVITFENGKPKESLEFGNAWGGAAFIWDALFNQYLKNPNTKDDSWLTRADDLWKLTDRDDLPLFEKAVHAATFDRAMIRKENFQKFAQHLREFIEKYPPGDKVCHLVDWADFIEKCEDEAIGFYGTSVSDNLWYTWNDKDEEKTPYDLNTNNEHFEVYDYLLGMEV